MNKNETLELKRIIFFLENELAVSKKIINDLEKKYKSLSEFFELVEDVYILRMYNKILFISPTYEKVFNTKVNEISDVFDSHYKKIKNIDYEDLQKWNKENIIVSKELEFDIDGKRKWFLFKSQPITDKKNNVIRRLEVYYDITEKKILEEKIGKLYKILPICSGCKKIRDNTGNWKDVEMFITEVTDNELSHTICPDCAKKLYGEILNQN